MGILGCDPKRAIDELVRGKGFAKRLKIMMNESGSSGNNDVSSTSTSPSPALEAEDLLKAVLTCFGNTLSMLLNNTTTTHDDVASSSPKEDFSSNLPADTDARKSPEYSGDSSCRTTSTTLRTKDRRGCYKRRKTCESWTQDSSIPVEDGHAWRKYGQKAILHAKYPRSYFRCTHKHDQGCKANKQVQRIDEEEEEDDNPNLLYRTTYYGHHTCTNDSNVLVDQYDDDQDRKDSSSVIDFRRQPNHHKNKNNCSSFFTSFQPVKHEYSSYNSMNKLNQDIDIPINQNHHHHHLSTNNYKYNNQISYSSSSDLLVSPFDQATDHVFCTPTTLDMGGYDDDDALQF